MAVDAGRLTTLKPGTRLRITFFGTDGQLSAQALAAIAREHRIVGVVRPRARRPDAARRTLQAMLRTVAGALGRRPEAPLTGVVRALGAPLWEAESAADPAVRERIAAARPDLLCIAGYPWLLGTDLLAIPPAGALNLHTALLPRHRGPLPLFWIYYHDDRQTGVTVHWVTERADAGDILSQEAWPLPRGFPVEDLNRQNAERGAGLLRRTLAEVVAGSAKRRAQDEALATPAPRIRQGAPMVDFRRWDAERVWHFLAGLYPRFREPLTTAAGRRLEYGGVVGHAIEPSTQPPGTVTPAVHGYDLHCLGGRVLLRRKSRPGWPFGGITRR